jgi:NH3-dependent NAD+ synthetase
MKEKTWFEGFNDYKKCTATYDDTGMLTKFHTEIRDVELMDTTNIFEILNNHLSQRQTKTVEVCFSGGLDSEVALLSCIHNKIPVKAITMRIYTGEVLINTHDVYYSEKFCREHNIDQKFVDLDPINKQYNIYEEILKIKPNSTPFKIGSTNIGFDF